MTQKRLPEYGIISVDRAAGTCYGWIRVGDDLLDDSANTVFSLASVERELGRTLPDGRQEEYITFYPSEEFGKEPRP